MRPLGSINSLTIGMPPDQAHRVYNITLLLMVIIGIINVIVIARRRPGGRKKPDKKNNGEPADPTSSNP